jgi:hypothetical protein
MPLHIDHISLASPHIFRSADALAKETGLGYWTGEWLRETSVNIVPLGPPGNFIEISGFIDLFALREMNERRQWLLDITATGDHFNGLCLGVDSMEELEAFAKHWKSTVNRADNPDPAAHFQRANGYILPMASTPVTKRSVWMLGLPNIILLPGSHAPLERSAHARHSQPGAPDGPQVGRGRRYRATDGGLAGRHAVRGHAAAEIQRQVARRVGGLRRRRRARGHSDPPTRGV